MTIMHFIIKEAKSIMQDTMWSQLPCTECRLKRAVSQGRLVSAILSLLRLYRRQGNAYSRQANLYCRVSLVKCFTVEIKSQGVCVWLWQWCPTHSDKHSISHIILVLLCKQWDPKMNMVIHNISALSQVSNYISETYDKTQRQLFGNLQRVAAILIKLILFVPVFSIIQTNVKASQAISIAGQNNTCRHRKDVSFHSFTGFTMQQQHLHSLQVLGLRGIKPQRRKLATAQTCLSASLFSLQNIHITIVQGMLLWMSVLTWAGAQIGKRKPAVLFQMCEMWKGISPKATCQETHHTREWLWSVLNKVRWVSRTCIASWRLEPVQSFHIHRQSIHSSTTMAIIEILYVKECVLETNNAHLHHHTVSTQYP